MDVPCCLIGCELSVDGTLVTLLRQSEDRLEEDPASASDEEGADCFETILSLRSTVDCIGVLTAVVVPERGSDDVRAPDMR